MRHTVEPPVYRKLLVPLDGSRFAEHAVPYAAAVALRTGASVEVIRVHELPVDLDGLVLDAQVDEELRERSRSYLERVAAAIAERLGAPVSTQLRVGRPAATIQERAREIGADLIVMSTHGRGGLERAWLGSVADELARSVEIPLLLVRPAVEEAAPPEAPGLDEIVVPLDGSDLSARIVPRVVALGQPKRMSCTLLRVVPTALVVGGHVFRLDEERAREVAASAAAYLERVAGPIRSLGARVRTRVVEHDAPAAAILEAARAARADLIAMTTHGYGGVRRLLLGSTADKVLRGAVIPVLLQRPGP